MTLGKHINHHQNKTFFLYFSSISTVTHFIFPFRLVNGNPNIGNKNIFRYQFSSDQQDLLQVYVALLIVYTILTPLQVYAAKIQNHPIARLLAAGLSTQFVALLLINFHFCLFAANGKGVYLFKILGEVLEIISESLFMLLLILLALGWAITRLELTCKITLVGLWSLYTILSCLLYVWMKVKILLKNCKINLIFSKIFPDRG